MAIPDEDVSAVRTATDLAALIGEHTALKRVGRRLVGLCPFHSEKTASFSVNAEEGVYYCFGCQASGDAISFVRAIEGCDFVEAVERLAARANLTIHVTDDPVEARAHGRRPRLYDVLSRAADFYHERLLNGKDARPARDYLRERGYDGSIARQFHLGYAPKGFDELVHALNVPIALAKEAGLGFENARGNAQDVFRERVIFPIYDPGNRVIAFGARVLPEHFRQSERDPGPKYRNSPESPVYAKRNTLYGLNWAKAAIVEHQEVIVCEGYTDVIGFFQAGIPRAVATCGTALTEDHFRLLSHFAKRVVLCFDADAAGQNAAGRLYEWEKRHELELAVAHIPQGSDPGQLAADDPDTLMAAIDGARPFLEFQIDRALERFALSSPEGRARAAEAAIGAIAEHPNDLVRDQYLVTIADRTSLEPERLRDLLTQTRNAPPRPVERQYARTQRPETEKQPAQREQTTETRSGQGLRNDAGLRAGRDALSLAIHRPEEAASRFHEVLFIDPIQHEAFVALCESNELHEAIDAATDEVRELLLRHAAGSAEEIDVDGTLIALTRTAAQVALREVELEAKRAGQAGDQAALEQASSTVYWLQSELELLRDPILRPGVASPAIDAVGRLIAWLVKRQGEST